MRDGFILMILCFLFMVFLNVAFCTEPIEEKPETLNSDIISKVTSDLIDHCCRHVEFFVVLSLNNATDPEADKNATPIPVARLPGYLVT